MDRNSSPPPPKDPYPTNTENSIFEKRIAAKLDERAFDTVNRSNEKLSACEMGEERQNQRSTLIKSANDISGTVESQDELLQSDLVDNAKLTGADQISIRPDTLRAAKRRLQCFNFADYQLCTVTYLNFSNETVNLINLKSFKYSTFVFLLIFFKGHGLYRIIQHTVKRNTYGKFCLMSRRRVVLIYWSVLILATFS